MTKSTSTIDRCPPKAVQLRSFSAWINVTIATDLCPNSATEYTKLNKAATTPWLLSILLLLWFFLPRGLLSEHILITVFLVKFYNLKLFRTYQASLTLYTTLLHFYFLNFPTLVLYLIYLNLTQELLTIRIFITLLTGSVNSFHAVHYHKCSFILRVYSPSE